MSQSSQDANHSRISLTVNNKKQIPGDAVIHSSLNCISFDKKREGNYRSTRPRIFFSKLAKEIAFLEYDIKSVPLSLLLRIDLTFTEILAYSVFAIHNHCMVANNG